MGILGRVLPVCCPSIREAKTESTVRSRLNRASESETLSQIMKRQTLRPPLSEVSRAKPGSWGQKMEWGHAGG